MAAKITQSFFETVNTKYEKLYLMKMKQVYIDYNGCCCVFEPVNIFESQKNQTNFVTDNTNG